MSLRPLNQQTAKSQPWALLPLQKTGLIFRSNTDRCQAWWRLNRFCHCDLWTSRQLRLNLEPVDIYKRQVSSFDPTRTNFGLGSVLTSYVIATSELTDSQVSLFNPTRTMFSSGCNTSWKGQFSRWNKLETRQGSRNKIIFIDSKKKGYMEARILQPMSMHHKIWSVLQGRPALSSYHQQPGQAPATLAQPR